MATNKNNIDDVSGNLFMRAGIEEQKTPYDWDGMPEFIQEDEHPFKVLTIRFDKEEHYLEFAKLIEQNLSEKTKSIWFPSRDRFRNTLLRWMDQ
jgi:hypothetical protein